MPCSWHWTNNMAYDTGYADLRKRWLADAESARKSGIKRSAWDMTEIDVALIDGALATMTMQQQKAFALAVAAAYEQGAGDQIP